MQRPLQKLNHHSPERILGGDFDMHAKGESLHTGEIRNRHFFCIQMHRMRGLQKIKLSVIIGGRRRQTDNIPGPLGVVVAGDFEVGLPRSD